MCHNFIFASVRSRETNDTEAIPDPIDTFFYATNIVLVSHSPKYLLFLSM